MPVRAAISVLVVASALILGELLFAMRRSRNRNTSGLEPVTRQDLLWLLGPFSLSYIVMLLPRGIYALLYDRYLLGLMPLAIILLIKLYQRVAEDELPAISFLMLGAFGLFSIAGTHDWFALNRARIVAVEEVQATGVPKTAIQGAFEYDGWTQIEAAGFVNEKRIEVPAGAFHENMRMYRLPERCRHFFGWYATGDRSEISDRVVTVLLFRRFDVSPGNLSDMDATVSAHDLCAADEQQHGVAEAWLLQSDHPERYSLLGNLPDDHVYRGFLWCWNVPDVYRYDDNLALSV